MAYSTIITYFLWLILGWFGAHHFYLRRDRHAFVWFWTLGGGFGIGWLAEVFRLPEYVRTANEDAAGETPREAGRIIRRPPVRVKRILGEMVFGWWLGTLVMAAVPEEIGECYEFLTCALSPAGVALGVHTVANIGLERCDIDLCFLVSYGLSPFLFQASKDSKMNVLFWLSALTTLAVNYSWERHEDDGQPQQPLVAWVIRACAIRSKRYRRRPTSIQHNCIRIGVFAVCCLAMWTCLLSAFYYNTHVTTDYGERVRVREALQNFFSSPAWTAFRLTGWNILTRLWEGGFVDFFRELQAALDPVGELNAYKVLDLNTSATEKEINERYRELARKFHPDRFANVDADEKKKVEERFIEIQQAYEKISTIKAKRMRKNIRY